MCENVADRIIYFTYVKTLADRIIFFTRVKNVTDRIIFYTSVKMWLIGSYSSHV
jgi:hypothetical protein